MIGVVIPAHNEAALISRCLDSVRQAAKHSALGGEPVVVFVAADACEDSTAATAAAIAAGARWIASTDADSCVAPSWLAEQLALSDQGIHAVCGVVEVIDWLDHSSQARRRFEATYFDVDGHPHVHGACLGFSREAYLATNGWESRSLHEDVAIIDAIQAAGFTVARSAAVRVTTSARRNARAKGGFADHLISLSVPAGARAPAC